MLQSDISMSQQRPLGAKTQNKQLQKTKTAIPSPSAESIRQPSHSVYLGMWTQGLWDDASLTIHADTLDTLQEKIGKKVAIAHFYTGWSNLTNPAFINQLHVL